MKNKNQREAHTTLSIQQIALLDSHSLTLDTVLWKVFELLLLTNTYITNRREDYYYHE